LAGRRGRQDPVSGSPAGLPTLSFNLRSLVTPPGSSDQQLRPGILTVSSTFSRSWRVSSRLTARFMSDVTAPARVPGPCLVPGDAHLRCILTRCIEYSHRSRTDLSVDKMHPTDGRSPCLPGGPDGTTRAGCSASSRRSSLLWRSPASHESIGVINPRRDDGQVWWCMRMRRRSFFPAPTSRGDHALAFRRGEAVLRGWIAGEPAASCR
jgi:hypothetical protein